MALVKFLISSGTEKNPRHLVKLTLVITVAALLLGSGLLRLADARSALISARGRYVSAQSEAASLPREERDLQKALQIWEEKKKLLWRSAESGINLKDIEDAVKGSGAQLTYAEPGKPVAGFFRNHLRAVPVKVGMQGTFPCVLAAVSALEQLASPGEVRQFRVVADQKSEVPGEVGAEVELVLYSLNPPEVKGKVPGQSGRYDPFFPLANKQSQQAPEAAAGSQEDRQKPELAPEGRQSTAQGGRENDMGTARAAAAGS